jgi:hypothetical protein
MPSYTQLEPRGASRILYVSDPSSIATRYLPDPVAEEDLRRWVDDVANAEVDIFDQEVYTQGWTTYWHCDKFDYDARPQHRRFLPLLDRGIQPLNILIEQSHQRGMTFVAGFRINDNHGHVSVEQGVGAGASFILNNPQWLLCEFPPGDFYRLSSPLDFTFAEVRAFILSVMTEVVERFDVDGLEMCFRDHLYFPHGTALERQPLMTDLVWQIRTMLDKLGADKGKRLLLGARVFATLEECHSLGLDVPTWVGEGLIDYLSPQDVMYADFSVPYTQFTALARTSNCLLYPAILPWSSWRARYRLNQTPLTQENRRALAQTIYGAGADGISFYNHFEIMHARGGAHAPFYPMALHDFHELRDPQRVHQGQRHYIFDPTWGGFMGFGEDRPSTGFVKANKLVLLRTRPNAQGEYGFCIYEDLTDVRGASLLFRAFHMTPADRIAVTLNGTPIPANQIRARDDEVRIDFRTAVDRNSLAAASQLTGGAERLAQNLQPPIEPPFMTYWFALTSPPALYGENRLGVALLTSDPMAQEDIVIDEVEVWVSP